jgi:hypothetical protein
MKLDKKERKGKTRSDFRSTDFGSGLCWKRPEGEAGLALSFCRSDGTRVRYGDSKIENTEKARTVYLIRKLFENLPVGADERHK